MGLETATMLGNLVFKHAHHRPEFFGVGCDGLDGHLDATGLMGGHCNLCCVFVTKAIRIHEAPGQRERY